MPSLSQSLSLSRFILPLIVLTGSLSSPAMSAMIADFEDGDAGLLVGEPPRPRDAGTARIDLEHAHTGNRSLRVELDLPRRGGSAELATIPMSDGMIMDDVWGMEFWCRTEEPRNLRFGIRMVEQSGEVWETDVPMLVLPQEDGQWQRVRIPLGWFRLITWERRDGRLQLDELDIISLQVRNAGGEPQSGPLWIDSLRFVDAVQTIPMADAPGNGFLPLNLDSVFDSDAIAWRTNPTDGDFHTGEWEPRTLPAENFPTDEVAGLAGIPFRTPPLEDGANNLIRSNGQVITGFPTTNYSAAYVLASGKFGDQAGDVLLHYADGSSEKVALRISDWSLSPQFGESVAVLLPYAYFRQELDRHREPRLFAQSLRVDATRALERIELPTNDYLKIFGITLATHSDPPAVGEFGRMALEEMDPRLHMADRATIDFTELTRPAGVLGGYVQRRQGNYRFDIPTFNGFLTFVADARNLPQGIMEWHRFQNRTFRLGGIEVLYEGTATGELEFLDSVTLRYYCDAERDGVTRAFSMYVSRAWPAALYEVQDDSFTWIDSPDRTKLHATVPTADGIETIALADGVELPIPSEPWLLLWHRVPEEVTSTRTTRDFASPMLVVPERRPTAIVASRARPPISERLEFRFDGSAGRVVAMPMYGIRQIPAAETRQWADEAVPESVIADARQWSRRLQRFPVALHQDYEVAESESTVTIRDHFDWIALTSEWTVEVEPFTPVSPTLMLAVDNGYDAVLPEGLVRTGLSTFYGPFAGVVGDAARYTIPVSPHVSSMLTLSDSTGLPLLEEAKARLAKSVDNVVPDDLEGFISISDISQDVAQLRLLAPSRLILGTDSNREQYARLVVENAFKEYNLKLEKEPQTGQYYLMDDRFWAKDALYDKEWSVGFILQGLWSHAYYHNDWGFIAEHWNEIRGLYRYYQIHFDWATNSTFTMTTGVGANSDGIRIAYDGMLAMARMAGRIDDAEARRDAVVRSARQRMSMYASWFGPQWAADHDYVMERYQHIAPEDAELRFSPDHLWVEYFTTNTSHTTDFFQTNHAFFVFNLGHLMFLHDTGIAESRLRSWIYETIPALHPDWCDGNARVPSGGRYYGDAHAMALLIARAILFEDTLEDTFECLRMATENTAVMEQWYSPAGLVPMVLAASLTGSAPRVLAPVQNFDILESSFDHATGVQRIGLRAVRDAQDVLRVLSMSVRPASVMINDEDVSFTHDDSSRYTVIPLEAKEGETITIVLKHGG